MLWVHPELLGVLEGTAEAIAPGVVLADRLLVGRGWWTVNDLGRRHHPVRYTLYSVKGGVGSSTTAAILAWHFARRGEDVLAVDLDIESPGLASALLEERAQPDFGVADWFVEELVGQGDRIVDQTVGSPAWTLDLQGTVWVAPAHGRDPGEYLANLGRVHMDTVADPWIARLQRLLTGLEARLRPTVVLIDSRNGLHDIAAATVTDIGAEVMLFADDSSATWTGYRILFKHWRALGLAARIRERLSVVSGLTPETDTDRYLARFRENAWDLFRDSLYAPFVECQFCSQCGLLRLRGGGCATHSADHQLEPGTCRRNAATALGRIRRNAGLLALPATFPAAASGSCRPSDNSRSRSPRCHEIVPPPDTPPRKRANPACGRG